MMKININEVPFIPQSSKDINISNQNSSLGNTLQKNNNNQIRKYLSPVSILKKKKSYNHNQFLSFYTRNNEKIKNSVISMNFPERDIYNNANNIKNTTLSCNNPIRISNQTLINIMNYQKQNHLLKKNRLTLGETFFFKHNKKAYQVDFPKKKSKKNLKQIQKELQHKLIDMSIRIENEIDQEEEDLSNPEIYFQRKENKRFTEYPNLKTVLKQSNIFKKTKTTAKVAFNNNLLKKSPNPEVKKENEKIEEPKSKDDTKARRNSFIPKSLLQNKFEKNNQQNLFRNLSVNMNLYRELIPHIDLNVPENEKSNMSNKTMLISKKNINIKKILLHSIKNEEFENKYRLLIRQKELYDSFEDEEVMDQLEDEYLFISPETYRIFIFDTLILFCTLFGSIYIPIYIAQSNCLCSYMPKAIEYIFFFHEGINIIDILISFFRAFYNFEFVLEKQNEKIIKHYLLSYFFLDLFAAVPLFSIAYYFCNIRNKNPDGDICLFNGVDLKFNYIKMFLGFKLVKLKKVLDQKANEGINYFHQKISENYTLEKTMKMLLFTLICIIGFNFFICYHIYVGHLSYPNWILKTNNQDSSLVTIYITSLYFLITTITSVGYGDITCVSLNETVYQIIILTIGVIAYSWIVSTVGNYVKKETRAAIKFNKDLSLLEEIRVSYPKMSFKLYNKIHKHLETVSRQQEKLDTNLLVTNLPYTLKNQIIFIIYGSIIEKFKFFKDCENSDFILRVLTSFIPLSTKQGAFIIQEGDIIDNIVFVREGRLSLVATIDLDNPLISINKYLEEKFEDINDKVVTKLDNSLTEDSVINMGLKKERATTVLKSFLQTKGDIEQEDIEQEMAKKDFNGEDIELGNFQFLNILDILKNEHYGIVYMLLKKPAPLSLRVKSKYSQLFLLRKNDTMQISKAYPNVWKNIYNKSYHNMKSIKKLTQKIIINYCNFKNAEQHEVPKTQDTNLLFKIGLLNSRKRKNPQKMSFNPEGKNNSNKNIPKPKSILKHKKENSLGLSNKSFYGGYKSFKTGNCQLNNKLLGSNLKISTTPNVYPNTNINQRNVSFFSSRNRLSSLGQESLIAKTKINQFNQINNIKYNIFINDVDLNKDSKTLLKSDEREGNAFNLKKSLQNLGSINNLNISKLKKVNFIQDIPSNINQISNFTESKNNNTINIYSSQNNNIKNNQRINNAVNLEEEEEEKEVDNNNNDEDLSKNDTLEINETEEKKSEKYPNTINDLSKSLLKKVKKKISKRRKRKKLYNMLLQKIAESFAKLNPNLNLNSSMNNNNNSFIFSSKIGDGIPPNPDLINPVIDEKPELNQNSTNQELNQNDNNNTNSPKHFHIPQSQEIITFPNPQELFLIPECLEDSSSESSSENSSDSKSSEKKEKEENNYKSKNGSKLNENNDKKKIELTISENTNFTLNMTYENLNKISEGNYSKDENLQKSVIKLIKVYLSEKSKPKKEKEKENEKEKGNKFKNNSVVERNTIVKSSLLRDNFKEKEKTKEKDVWSFLDYDDDKKDNDSLEKVHSKSPKINQKKTNDKPKNKKTKKIYDNLFNLDESITPKNKKILNNKKSVKGINKTTVKKIKRKKTKKKKTYKTPIKSHPFEKDEDKKNDDDIKKDENKEKEEEINISSLNSNNLEDIMDQKDYKNKNYKTYQNKGKNKEEMENGENCVDNNDINSKDGNNYE